MKRTEQNELRTANRKVFVNEDHTTTTQIYLDPVHYEDEEGEWQEMDDSLLESEDESLFGTEETDNESGFVNTKGTLKFHFKKHAKEKNTISIEKEGFRLAWGFVGCSKIKAQKNIENGLVYSDILKDTDLECYVRGEQIKENLILKSKETPGKFVYRYRLKDLTPVLEGQKIHFYGDIQTKKRKKSSDYEDIVESEEESEFPKEIFTVTAPYMKDAAGARSDSLTFQMEEEKNKEILISLLPDKEWLASPDRRYPIIIDPVTTTSQKQSDIYDAHVDAQNPGDNYWHGIYLKTRGGDKLQRSFLRFPLPEIQTGDMVVSARLVMVSLAQDGNERTIAVHRVLQPWESSQLTWRNAPIYENTVQDICKFTGDQQKYVTLNITRMVKDWYENGGNYGLMVKDLTEESRYTEFLASECDDSYSGMRPRIDITYMNYSGLEDYYSYHSQSVGRAGTVHVNDYNGNLILEHSVGNLGGSRMPVSLAMIYNTNDRLKNIGYGAGWRLSLHETIKKVTIGGNEYYQHVEGDGTVHYYYYDSDKKKWLDEVDRELELTINTTSEDAFVIKDKNNNRSIFNQSGYLVKLSDQNNNTTRITYGDNRITKVTDCTGLRSYTVNYLKNSAGKRTNIREVVSPAEEKQTFYYSGSNIVSIVDHDGERISYRYDEGTRLIEAKNIDGYRTVYVYGTEGACRVKKITEYGGDTEGNSLLLTYGYNSTKFTDQKGRKEIYRFDTAGNLIHIQDEFGHALSAKFNKDGKHVNRLENETKLQDNIIQLLKDPIIQEPENSSPWNFKTGSNGAATACRNTDTQHCKTGTQSLKLVSTSVDGNGYWKQDVKVAKGKTYTFSMYVKVAIESLGTEGGCFLRARYYDKEGTSIQKDSEVLVRSTDRFLQLGVTFKIPEDAKSDVVSLYFYLQYAEGTAYGDMAQFEVGNTANRCNLVENGSFHLGTIEGYAKTGSTDDKLIIVGNAAADGNSRAIGSTGAENAAMAYPNGILYKAASSDSGYMLEGISRGSRLSLLGSSTDSNQRTWYQAMLLTDGKKYQGYVPKDQIIRLCHNAAKGKTGSNAKLYGTPSLSSSKQINAEADCIQNLYGVVDNADGRFYAVLYEDSSETNESGDREARYYYIHEQDLTIQKVPELLPKRTIKLQEMVPGLDTHVYMMTGSPTENKKLTKILEISGEAGDTYMANVWGRGTALPESDNDKDRCFGVEVIFVGTDGKEETHSTNFSPDILDWQFLSDVYVAKKSYKKIKISYTYCHQANAAFFDGLSLFKEEFGQTYTYDEDNNLISVTDAQKKTAAFEYNSNQDMTGITDCKGNKFTYEYDSKHNPVKGTSAQKVVHVLTYDSAGNIIKSGCQNPENSAQGTWINRTFTTDKNHVASVSDAGGNTVRYQWDENRDLLSSVTDARGSVMNYAYDTKRRLTSVSMKVGAGGALTAEKTYAYTKDHLTGISHNGFQYAFDYDPFGNLQNASAAGQEIVRYEREEKNGNLLKCIYGNGDYLRYEYDRQDRIDVVFCYNAATQQETKLYSYGYNKQGELFKVTNHTIGKTYQLYYDFLGRLMRTLEPDTGYSYEYHYDANNNMTSLRQSAEAVYQTSYGYDKDSRETIVKSFGHTRTTHYDKYGRVERKVWNEQEDNQYATLYRYYDSGNNCYGLVKQIMVGGRSTYYEYDGNGNITKISEGILDAEGKTSTFQYDRQNQLIRENNHLLNKTMLYGYDLGGNLTRIREYAFTTDSTLPETPLNTITGTFDPVWKDQLISWNGFSMTYDSIGNMLTKGNTSYTWTQGRKLSTVNGNGHASQYFYDYTGMRVRKIVDGVTTDYRMVGDLLMSQKQGNAVTFFSYDSNTQLIGMSAGNQRYFYLRNAQNDIIGLIDEDGNRVVEYKYDSWGKLLSITGSLANTIGKRNPFRYRGYYYDDETEMYYLQKRYYDPEIKRFLNADEIQLVGTSPITLINKNLYTYCDGNPTSRKDTSGKWWDTVFDIIGIVDDVVSIVSNPSNPINYIALTADVVGMVVPGLTGGGRLVRTIDKSADTVETAKNLYKAADKASDLRKATGSYEIFYKSGNVYVGKGGFRRAIQSASKSRIISGITDEVMEIRWEKAATHREAFIREYQKMKRHAVKNTHTYNKIWSPGRKIFMSRFL